MSSSVKFPVLRQSLIVFSFLALVGLFFALNYLIFIPRQQQAYHSKIFRVLEEIGRDFGKSLEGKADYIAKNRNRKQPTETTKTIADCSDTLLRQNLFSTFKNLDRTFAASDYKVAYTFFTDSVAVVIKSKEETFNTVAFSLADLVDTSIESLHKEVFDLVLLVSRDTTRSDKKITQAQDRILYTHGELAASYIVPGDTLFKDARYGQFSSMNDIAIAGTNYKAFTHPFRMGGKQLMFVGFVKGQRYTVTTTAYPRPYLLWIILLFTLFILSLPLIKIYLSSRQERLTTNDIRMMMVVFIGMPLLVALLTFTVMIYRRANNQTTANLKELHQQVESHFTKEIRTALDQLKAYDTLLSSHSRICEKYVYTRDSMLKNNKADFKDVLLYPHHYPNLDDVFWVNDSGRQIGKWFFLYKDASYLDLSTRNYFLRMKKGLGFVSGNDSFYVELTVSWATNEYSVNIVTRSNQRITTNSQPDRQKQAFLVGLAATMSSVCDPVMPKGYNFCIINTEGDILFHSQTERSLHENLFEESNNNVELRNAILKKSRTLLDDVQLFDRTTKTLASPVKDMPTLYLVSYFNKREQNLFVFHVSAFTLLCISLTLFGLLLLVLLYYFFGKRKISRRFATYDAAWLKPSSTKLRFYRHNMLQQLLVVTLALLLYFAIVIFENNHFWFLLQASVLLPFLVLTGYILHRNEFNEESRKQNEYSTPGKSAPPDQKKSFFSRNFRVLLIYSLTVALLLVTLNYFQQSINYLRLLPVIGIILLPISVPVLVVYVRRWSNSQTGVFTSGTGQATYLTNYTILVFLSTFFISVLPTLGIGLFALNEEKQMQIKAAQFHIAQRIEQRSASLNEAMAKTKLAPADSLYKMTRKYAPEQGIYLLQNALSTGRFYRHQTQDTSVHSRFYQTATRFLFLPKDHADFFENNATYYWYKPEAKVQTLVYKNEMEPIKDFSLVVCNQPGKGIQPTGHYGYGFWLIIVSAISFLVLQYMLLQAITRKVFLLDYFGFDKKSFTNKESQLDIAWINNIYKNHPLNNADFAYLGLESSTVTNEMIAKREQEVDDNRTEEETILQMQHIMTPAYDAIWQKLTSEAQFVLYDFALDGLANYRNIDIIYALYHKGIIVSRNQQLELMTNSFRSYLAGKAGTEEIVSLVQKFKSGSKWKNLKNIFFALFFAIIIFLFATQQDASNRILFIISGLATLVPALLKIFDRNLMGGDAKKAT